MATAGTTGGVRRRRRFQAVALAAPFLLAALVIGRWLWPAEPVYDGLPLSRHLYPELPDFIGFPTDVYGHIHEQMWDRLRGLEPSWDGDSPQAGTPDPKARMLRLDTNALPWLVRWIDARPGPMERVQQAMDRFAPEALARFLPAQLMPPAERWHFAAFDGFQLLGSNALPALPQLTELLYREDPELTLTWSIASLGDPGIAVLARALSSTNAARRSECAAALGLEAPRSRAAYPALVDCVVRGDAEYHVLGAIGRIRGRDPRLVPALVRLLEATPPPAECDINLAVLVLGLEGDRARAAVPVLRRMYAEACGPAHRPQDPERHVLRRVLRVISPEEEGRLPPATEADEQSEWY